MLACEESPRACMAQCDFNGTADMDSNNCESDNHAKVYLYTNHKPRDPVQVALCNTPLFKMNKRDGHTAPLHFFVALDDRLSTPSRRRFKQGTDAQRAIMNVPLK